MNLDDYEYTADQFFARTEDGLEVEVIRIEKINELLDLADSWLANSVYKTVDVKPSF